MEPRWPNLRDFYFSVKGPTSLTGQRLAQNLDPKAECVIKNSPNYIYVWIKPYKMLSWIDLQFVYTLSAS